MDVALNLGDESDAFIKSEFGVLKNCAESVLILTSNACIRDVNGNHSSAYI